VSSSQKTPGIDLFCMMKPDTGPDWNQLYEIAAAQEGYFTATQAETAGYYPQLLHKHLRRHRIARVRRGIYRLIHFPAGDHEDLVVLWLWSEQAGVLSHETALALLELSDVLPAQAHMTVPLSWKVRRLRVPDTVILYYADLEKQEIRWQGSVPTTSPSRTLQDCAEVRMAPDLLRQALEQGLQRGLFRIEDVRAAREYLEHFEAGSL